MAGNVQIKLDTKKLDNLRKHSPAKAASIVKQIAFAYEADVKNSFTSPSPSSPGEAPAVDTGTLKNSIHAEQIGAMLWRVVDGVLYGVFLEYGTRKMKARPFFTPAARRIEKKIASYFKSITNV